MDFGLLIPITLIIAIAYSFKSVAETHMRRGQTRRTAHAMVCTRHPRMIAGAILHTKQGIP